MKRVRLRKARVGVVARVVAEERHARHHLDAARERPVQVPCRDLRRRVADRRETRHAVVVQRERVRVVGDAGMQLGHQRDVGALVTHLVDTTQHQRLDVPRVVTAGLQAVDQASHEFLRLHLCEAAFGPCLAARRAHGVVDVGVCHGFFAQSRRPTTKLTTVPSEPPMLSVPYVRAPATW